MILNNENTPHILVTGGTGLVGAHLLASLIIEGNSKVRATYRDSSSFIEVKQVFSYYVVSAEKIFDEIEWVKVDILDVSALKFAFDTITHVYHCAGLVSFDDRLYKKIKKTNIEGTANMVNVALLKQITKFCYVSSIATLDNQVNKNAITEQNYWNPSNNKMNYSMTKYGGEMEVWRAIQEGLNAVIINPGVILGSGFWHSNSSSIFSKVDKGFNFYTKGITGFVGVWDVVKIMMQLMQKNDTINDRYIVVSENLSYEDILNKIAQSINKTKPKYYVTPFISQIIWRLDTLKSIITKSPISLSKDAARSSHDISFYQSNKIKRLLNFDFENIDNVIKHSIRNYIK